MKKIDVKCSVEEEAQRIADLLGITIEEFVETIVADYIQNFEEPEDYDQEQQFAIEREETIKHKMERFRYD